MVYDFATLSQSGYGFFYYISFTINYYVGFIELLLVKVLTARVLQNYRAINAKLRKKHTPEEVQKLMNFHYDLTKLANDANDLFGIPSLILMGSNFQLLTICIYFIILFTRVNYLAVVAALSCIKWCATTAAHVWITAHMWHTLAKEVSRFFTRKLDNLLTL